VTISAVSIGLEADEGSERIRAAYGANYERLAALKHKYDPTNLFHHNQNISRRCRETHIATV
jgi:FAD/FMN-containing dehydrogenase